MADYAKIFKAYDIRGTVPDELDESVAEAVGGAFARLTGAPSVVTVHDMRTSSAPLAEAFAHGAAASHNPAKYNGIKLCREGAKPVGEQTGLRELRAMAEAGVPASVSAPGRITARDLLSGYAAYLNTLVDLSGIRPLKVAVDAGNGMAGYTVPKVFEGLPIEIVPLYFELDGTFPNHEPNPIDPGNVADLQRAVVSSGADIGLAFDGDADRCFVVDERGELVSPSVLTALIAVAELRREPGAAIIHNLITSRAVPEIVTEHGGIPVRTRVGHSFIKTEMAAAGAIFGGEHSGHFYFRDFWFADSGMLAALHVLAALGSQAGPLSPLLSAYARYQASGEINSEVRDQQGATQRVREVFAGRDGVTTDELDGLTVSGPGWWFNLRPSNTEPLLRLNVEAPDQPTLTGIRDQVLRIVHGDGG